MTASIIVWDHKNDPLDVKEEVLCWRSYVQKDMVSSIPRYLENHSERFRAKYLAFIHDLGESRIDGKRIIDYLDTGNGFSFWWMTRVAEKSPFKSPRIYDCLRLLALEEILLDRKTTDLTFCSSDPDLVKAIRQLCRNLKISFTWQPGEESKQKWSLHSIYRGLPFPVQGLISLATYVLNRWLCRNLKKPRWFSGKNAIFMCSYFVHLDPVSCAEGHFYSRQWGTLIKHLHDSGILTNWIQHFFLSSVVPDIRTGLSWLRLFNLDPKKQGHHAFLETYLSWSVVIRTLKSWLWLNVVSWRLRKIRSAFYPNQSAVWLWPVLRSDWLTSLNGPIAISNCLYIDLFDAVLKDMPHQKIGFYLWENQGWESALLRAWQRHGHGDIIGVPHSTVGFWHMNSFDDPRNLTSNQNCAKPLPNRLAINGPMAWKSLANAGYPVEQLVEVEALRYLNLSQVISKSTLDSARVDVLILGDMIPAAMHNLLRLLEDTMRLLPSGYRFTLKPHPCYTVHLADYPGLQADETSEALDHILGQYDIALAANFTSASADAYVAGLPVIVGLDENTLNLSPLRGHSEVRFASRPEELAEALQTAHVGLATNHNINKFFFMNPELPRWQRLLSSASPARTDSKPSRHPKISICIPTYNRAAHLTNCLQSIISNNARAEIDFEVCVSDNCSTDETESVVASAQKKMPIQYQKNLCNLGIPKNFLNVVEMATGEFVWLIGDDDLLLSDALKELSDLIGRQPDVDFFYINSFHLTTKYVSSFPQPFDITNLPKQMTPFSSWSKSGEMTFMDLIDPKISFDFLGGMFLSVFRRQNWIQNVGVLNQVAVLDLRTFSCFDNTFPHVKIFSRAFANSKAFFHAKPLSVCLSGAREWAPMYPFVHSVRLIEALNEYRKNGLPYVKYLQCRNYALNSFIPDFVKMLIHREHSGFVYIKPLRLVLDNCLYPNFYFSFIYYFVRKLKTIIVGES